MFTENQVRQFYVIPTGNADTTNVKQPTAVVSGSSGTYAADLKALATGACQFVVNDGGQEAYLMYKGPLDGPQRSDLIKKCNVMDVRLTDADDLKHIKKRVEVTLATLNGSSSPIVGQDYILNVNIHNYIAMDYNTTKIKFGVARAEDTTASNLYKKLAINLAKNFAREPVQLVKIYLKNASTPVEVKPSDTMTSLASAPSTATGIIIEEAEQPWRKGAAPVEYVDFEVVPSTVYVSALGADLVWGTVTDASSASYTIVNSKKVADMEWFFMKERADKYGEFGWPYNVDTVLQVNPDLAAGYSFVDIHYYFEGNSHNVGKSEKTLTIVGSKANLKRLIGTARVTGGSPADPTGLYAFLEDTNVAIKTSASW